MHWFGWKWSVDTKWNAVLLWGAVASDGMYGPRASAFWRYIMSACWYDWTRGLSFIHVFASLFVLFLLLYRIACGNCPMFAEWRIYHITRCEKQQTFWKCFQHSFQSQQVYRFWISWSLSYTSGRSKS